MKRLHMDKIAAATKNARLDSEVYLSPQVTAAPGYVVAVRVLNDKAVYNQLENVHGRLMRLKSGDQIAGVLGHRRALRGYAGVVPDRVAAGDRLNLLNMGGVVGRCTSYNPDVGPPFEVEVLGAVLHFPYLGERVGEPAHIGSNALPADDALPTVTPPLVAVVGTCMHAGKTVAACEVIHGLSRRGLSVAAGKVTGVALQRDVLNMQDHGAIMACSFLDAGVASTDRSNALDSTRRVVSRLLQARPDAIVLEFGDGLLGEYGVQSVLADTDLRGRIAAVVLCAADPVGAWGGVRLLAEKYGLEVHVVSGPVTDNEVGRTYISEQLGLPAANALTAPADLVACVAERVVTDVG